MKTTSMIQAKSKKMVGCWDGLNITDEPVVNNAKFQRYVTIGT